jgi:Fur family ferric uptake transcriptional regulator
VLEEMRLVQRFEAARGTASYERIDPSGHHHHHAICRRCGRMEPFEDRGLERAIGEVAAQVPFEIAEHDVVLRGLCERCAG